MKYHSEIDGIRSIAIISVIMFHGGFNTFSGGYVGVDIFFVISGYLITTILINDLQAEDFSIVEFYYRRARRIFPALFFVIFITIPFAWILLPPDQLISFSKSVSAASLFVSNFFFLRDGGYFQTAAELKPLLHTWSLAVEVQYYIFFPVFLLLFWRFGKRFIFLGLVLAAIISLVIAQVGATLKPIQNFLLLPSRVWEIAIGAIAALCLINNYFSRIGLKSKQIFSFLGLVFIILAIFLFNNETPTPSIYCLLPTIGAALIILFAEQTTYVGKLLSSRIFVGIGVISYSLYLWHQPILAFSKIYNLTNGSYSKIAILALIFILSILSWKYIESPFRNQQFFSRKFIFIGSLMAMTLFILYGSWVSQGNISPELKMARTLTKSDAIYVSNINERKFLKARIEFENQLPAILVIGSSRLMQVNGDMFSDSLLNLSMSSAYLQDYLAIWYLASKKFKPRLVLIGAEPWLFNAEEKHIRWQTLESEYYSSLLELDIKINQKPSNSPSKNISEDSLQTIIFNHLNIYSNGITDIPSPYLDKIRKDGSRIYNLGYANKTDNEVNKNAVADSYLINPYIYSAIKEEIFKKLINAIEENSKVVFILSPIHPTLYKYMLSINDPYIKNEILYRELAERNGIEIIGSYDPKKIGCLAREFYDGIHPKDTCLIKVLNQLKN